MLEDLRDGKILKDFMKNYNKLNLDVMSIAEAKSLIENSTEVSDYIDNKTKNQILMVLDYVDKSLKYVSHERRKVISLGEYITNHHYMNASTLTEFNNDILKGMISKVLGESANLQETDVYDWQFGLARTSPRTHKQEDARVAEIMEHGKGLDSNSQISIYVDKIW